MEPDYILQIYDIGTPLVGAITNHVLLSFYNLYLKKTDFTVWYDKNENQIDNIPIDMKYKSFFQYTTIDLSELIHVLNTGIRLNIGITNNKVESIEKLDEIHKFKPIPIMNGGEYNKNKIINFCIGIMFYLFSPEDVSKDHLPIAIDKTTMSGGGVVMKDISGAKSKERVVVILGVNSKEHYVLKFTPDLDRMENYKNEIAIYEELNDYMLKREELKNNIVKIYEHGQISIYPPKQCMICVNKKYYRITDENILNRIGKLKPIPIYYTTLEYNREYKTLRQIMRKRYHITEEEKYNLIRKITIVLYTLNRMLGFAHMDLHVDNILIDRKFNNFKLFDFDLSITKNTPNMTFFDIVTKIIMADIPDDKLMDRCFMYDITRLLIGMDPQGFPDSTHPYSKLINIFMEQEHLTALEFNNDITNSKYFDYMQIIAVNLADHGFIPKYILPIIRYDLIGSGRDYYLKYLKYKNKYLILKNI